MERQKLEALKQHAHKFDIDHDVDYARPGNNPPERAYHMLRCGADLLVEIMDSGFPSHNYATRKAASRWTRENLLYKGGPGAAFMACAGSTLMSYMGGRLGDEDADEVVVGPQLYDELRQSVADFYATIGAAGPMSGLARCCDEFEVMKHGKLRQEVVDGEEPANGYSAALLRGENPNEDPELVEMQRRYARDFFIYKATFVGMRRALHGSDVRRLSRKAIPFLDPDKRRVRKHRERALAAWIEGSRPLREYALIEFQQASATAAPVAAPPR